MNNYRACLRLWLVLFFAVAGFSGWLNAGDVLLSEARVFRYFGVEKFGDGVYAGFSYLPEPGRVCFVRGRPVSSDTWILTLVSNYVVQYRDGDSWRDLNVVTGTSTGAERMVCYYSSADSEFSILGFSLRSLSERLATQGRRETVIRFLVRTEKIGSEDTIWPFVDANTYASDPVRLSITEDGQLNVAAIELKRSGGQ
jgi:hypothetical protein